MWIAEGKLRVGDYKLITSNCGGRGLTGTGGGWIVPPTNATRPYPQQGKDDGSAMDSFLEHGCNASAPCLYKVGGGATPYASDAIEARNLAADPAHAHVLAAMQTRLREVEATTWQAPAPAPNNNQVCEAAARNGGVLVPWMQDP